MGGIVAAALHAQGNEPLYPLSGIIANGMGNTQSTIMKTTPPSNTTINESHVMSPAENKDAIMFKPGTVVREIIDLCEHFNAAAQVSGPVLFCLVEDDPFFVADEAELEICARAFGKSVLVERVLFRDAPHCMELSYWSQAWYARCFGFAMEGSGSLSVRV
ncbi:hypothetical protein BJX66DRAFT_320764 [Aspergillus keveii]|uniref:Alpha/beta hydrolase fold-3 domain-containing protein n=1 Tax=Aspergillus keveii TaxID=714993 RepID=A0ABR4FGR7_9EURO